MEGGSFVLKDVRLSPFLRIDGKAMNNTGRAWESATFQVIPLDSAGNVVPAALGSGGLFATIYGSAPGESTKLWWDRRSEGTLRLLREYGVAVARFEVRFDRGFEGVRTARRQD